MKLATFNLFLEQVGTPTTPTPMANVIEVSTGILGVIDTSLLDPELILSPNDDEDDEDSPYADYYWHKFKGDHYYSAMYNHVKQFLQPRLDTAILGLGIGIDAIRFKSYEPWKSGHSWGFDMLLEFTVEEDFVETLTEHIQAVKPVPLARYFAIKWGHTEGFASYMPQDKAELLEFLQSGDERQVERAMCSYLLYVIGDDTIAQWNEDLADGLEYKHDADTYYEGAWRGEGDEDSEEEGYDEEE